MVTYKHQIEGIYLRKEIPSVNPIKKLLSKVDWEALQIFAVGLAIGLSLASSYTSLVANIK